MYKDLIVTVLLLAVLTIVPIIFVTLRYKRPKSGIKAENTNIEFPEKQNELTVSKSEILEEFFRHSFIINIGYAARNSNKLTYAEKNIISFKTIKLGSFPIVEETNDEPWLWAGQRLRLPGSFPIAEETNEEPINKWLVHPGINSMMVDPFIMSMAAQIRISSQFMENLLRKLLEDSYDFYFKIAEEKAKSQKANIIREVEEAEMIIKRGNQEEYRELLDTFDARSKGKDKSVHYLTGLGFSYRQAQNAVHVYFKGGELKAKFILTKDWSEPLKLDRKG